MSLQYDTSTTLGELVVADHRAASVLDRFGLDFCCGGKRTLGEACAAARLDPAAVGAELDKLLDTSRADDAPDTSWPLEELTDYIVRRHHGYVRQQLPVIAGHLEKLITVHGERHPELRQLAGHFAELSGELQSHMMKEEQMLFPYVRQLAASAERGVEPPAGVFGTVRNPIRMMEAEHRYAGDELGIIRGLSGNYCVPSDGCATYRVCYVELAAFDADLRQHIHLENNLLFPHAVSLETAVNQLRA